MRVGICITTHNRREELARTLRELARLKPPPAELLVVADGCTDGTVEFLGREHGGIQRIVHEVARGSIPSRNEMAAASTCDVFVSLDDDSYPLEPDFLAKVDALFTAHPRLAVASFPQRTDEMPETLTMTDFGPPQFVVLLKLGGYPEWFFHMYEEPDFALRCVAAGWQVWHETSLTVRHHFTSTQRNEMRVHQRHARNELWSVLLRCPAPQLFFVAAFRAARQFGYAWHRGLDWVVREPQWWLAFLGGIPRCLAARAPVPWPRYLAWMRLLRRPIEDSAEWEARFSR
jgi:GT2 family glycosyltransferase